MIAGLFLYLVKDYGIITAADDVLKWRRWSECIKFRLMSIEVRYATVFIRV